MSHFYEIAFRRRWLWIARFVAAATFFVGEACPVSAQSPPSKPPSQMETLLKELDARADEMGDAKEVLAFYEKFLREFEPTGELRNRAMTRISRLKEPAASGFVRLGANWVSPTALAEARAKENELLEEARSLLSSGADAPKARDKLLEASRCNPDGVMADFVLGLVYATVVFDLEKADDHFKKVLSRQPGSAAAQANLGLIELKTKKWNLALNHLRSAALGSLNRAEVVQNVGRVVAAAKDKQLRIEPASLNKFSALLQELTATDPHLAYDATKGWLYMLPAEGLAPGEQPVSIPEGSSLGDAIGQLELRGRALGFAIAPGFVVTHRDIARLDTGHIPAMFRLQWPGLDGKPSFGRAKLRVLNPLSGLALMECRECEAVAVPLASEKPAVDTRVVAGRTTLSGDPAAPVVVAFSTNIRSTRSTVVGSVYRLEPAPLVASLGSPLLGADGKVLGLIAGFALPGEKASTSPWGIPAASISKFLREQAPDVVLTTELSGSVGKTTSDSLGGRAIFVEAYARQATFDWTAVRGLSRRKDNPRSIEDPSCTWCGGSGRVDCENRDCLRGSVSVRVPVDTVEGVGGGARVVRRFQTVQEPCDTCSARGVSPCPLCGGKGRDPKVR
jgi:tetratricopeptide (TPR) repeat protein